MRFRDADCGFSGVVVEAGCLWGISDMEFELWEDRAAATAGHACRDHGVVREMDLPWYVNRHRVNAANRSEFAMDVTMSEMSASV